MPSRSKVQYVSGISDSPMWKRGNFARSITRTLCPASATSVATVDPEGPPPITTTSYVSVASVMIPTSSLTLIVEQSPHPELRHPAATPVWRLYRRAGDDCQQSDRGFLVAVDRADPPVHRAGAGIAEEGQE